MNRTPLSRRDWLQSATASGLVWAGGISQSHPVSADDGENPIVIGSRRELFVDGYLIDKLQGARQRIHHPTPREVVLTFDKPWEGSGSGGYVAIVKDGDMLRMYYKAWHLKLEEGKLTPPHPPWVACAESRDGIHWTRPDLGLFEFNDSTRNNIVWQGDGSHGFSAFVDENPACAPDAKYKAVGGRNGEVGAGLFAMKSRDGIRWSPMQESPVVTKGRFDSQNLAFWDSPRREYRVYIRESRGERRDIATATSRNFIDWTEPQLLEYPGAPDEELYTNQVAPYYRAPHIFIGFPTRYIDRGWLPSTEALPELEHRRRRAQASRRYGTALTEALLMSSRDGRTFHRWSEAFLRPGIERPDTWNYGQQYLAWPVIETASPLTGAPNELSLYASESYWTGRSSRLRRYTLRIDGFVSVNAPRSGGELVTKPVIFDGSWLAMNFSTSAAGSVRVELQEAEGKPIPGFTLADCPEIFGDTLDRVVSWKQSRDVKALAGRPARLRFELKDADLYSIRFIP